MVRLQRERSIEALQCALMLSSARQQQCAVVMGRSEVRVERNRPLEALQRVDCASH